MRCRGWSLPLLLVALGCGRHPRTAPLGEELAALPRAASPSLLAQIPASARAVLALDDPWRSWERLAGSTLVGSLRAQGLLENLLALAWIERWEAMRARLGELARRPLPDLAALLHGAAVVAWLPEDAETEGGWLWVERLGPEAAPALEFARVLNAVHASGADVEIGERKGISLRRVRFGPGVVLHYYVLADRLAVSTDRVVIERSLDLAVGGKGSAAGLKSFARLEESARADGFAASIVGGPAKTAVGGPAAPAHAPLLLTGVRRIGVAGHHIEADLDPTLWGPATSAPVWLGNELVQLDAAGLDLPRAWAAVRPHPAAGAPELPILDDIDRLARVLGRGAWLAAVPAPSGELVPELGLAVAGAAAEPLRKLLADAIQRPLPDSDEDLPGGGVLSCPWGEEGPLCLAVCPSRILLSTRDLLLAAGVSVCAPAATLAEPRALALLVRPGDPEPALRAGLVGTSASGAFSGEWMAAGALP